MGLRFVKRDAIDCDRISEKRLEMFRREVSASRGMLMRAILMELMVIEERRMLGRR